jgi:hypothetical protein
MRPCPVCGARHKWMMMPDRWSERFEVICWDCADWFDRQLTFLRGYWWWGVWPP